MKKFFLILACALVVSVSAKADEGMWMLPYLQKVNYADMKAKGLKLRADDIYNAKGSSLKDAIVIFGNGCTGEIVSPDGLLFTNHHCGYGNIQQLSTVENDYLKNGFWAMSRQEEIPVPGLSVRFIRSIEDVTARVLAGITMDMQEIERGVAIQKNIEAIGTQMKAENGEKTIQIKPFFGGNEYFAFVIEEYKDIRFVGAPPTSIGKFGGDTDNWMWPRHTGDFSIFRVYSAPDGSAAEYSAQNVPYKAPVHLKISAQGYKEGDFAMVMGFPGTTTRYMTTYEIDEMLNISNPNRIYIRGERQDILKRDMEASDKVRIQYASKYARSSNYWKNSIGMSTAIQKLGVRDQKHSLENQFQMWAGASPARAHYAQALPMIRDAVQRIQGPQGDAQVLAETVLTSIEISRMAALAFRDMDKIEEADPAKMAEIAGEMYKDYNESTDKKVTKRMIEIMFEMLPESSRPEFMGSIQENFAGDVGAYTDWLYENSAFANREKFEEFGNNYDLERLTADPALALYNDAVDVYRMLADQIGDAGEVQERGHRLYVAGLREMQTDVMHYPDANFTIRLTYGTILPYSPADAVDYNYYTTLKGVMQKENPENPTDFTVPPRLKALYQTKDYGRYADYTGVSKRERRAGNPGQMVTCFLSTNDITGGNSGSPVLNGKGELIGLAFDGNWEAMSGDVVFEPELQRCINVDVRYVLFIIDKYAGAGHLLNEMSIVW